MQKIEDLSCTITILFKNCTRFYKHKHYYKHKPYKHIQVEKSPYN